MWLFEGYRHGAVGRDGDGLNGLLILFFFHQAGQVDGRNLRWEAGISRRDTLEDQADYLLRLLRFLQPPVDGVGQADNFTGGCIGGGGRRCGRVLRRLPPDLRQQGFIGDDRPGAALLTLQVQRVRPLGTAAEDTLQPAAAVLAVQPVPQAQDGPVVRLSL